MKESSVEEIRRKILCLTDPDIEYIDRVKTERGLPNASMALREIIREHESMSSPSVASSVWDEFEKRYGSKMTRIRLGVNTADRNSKVIIKMLNSFFMENGNVVWTSEKETESAYLALARQELKDEIGYYKQLKDNRNGTEKE